MSRKRRSRRSRRMNTAVIATAEWQNIIYSRGIAVLGIPTVPQIGILLSLVPCPRAQHPIMEHCFINFIQAGDT